MGFACSGQLWTCSNTAVTCISLWYFPFWWQGDLNSTAFSLFNFLIRLSDHQTSFFFIALGCGGTISKMTICTFDTRAVCQCDLPGQEKRTAFGTKNLCEITAMLYGGLIIRYPSLYMILVDTLVLCCV